MAKRAAVVLIVLPLILSSFNMLTSSATIGSKPDSFVANSAALPSIQSNEAYLNSSVTYYSNIGTSASGTVTMYAIGAYVPQSWFFLGGSVGTAKAINSSDEINLGDYQYNTGSEIGDGGGYGTYSNGLNLNLFFVAGIDNHNSFDLGTVYASLIFINISSGLAVQTLNWSYIFNDQWTGYGGVEVSPYWFGNIGGYFDIYLYVGATPYTNYTSTDNYAIQSPGNLESGPDPDFPGTLLNQYGIQYPAAGSAYSIDGWVYNGLGISDMQYNATSASFSTSFSSGVQATQLAFSSPFAVQLVGSDPYGAETTAQATSGSINYSGSGYLPNGGWLQDVLGNPNVPQFNIRWYTANVTVKNSGIENTTAVGTLTENQNWFNATGQNSYLFILNSPADALNGITLYGLHWNTTWKYTVQHLLNSGFGANFDAFYVNGAQITSPGRYVNATNSTQDGNQSNTVAISYSTANLVNYYSVLLSTQTSSSSVYITEQVTLKINTSEQIPNEPDYVFIQWGDGQSYTSNSSLLHNFTLNHVYVMAGNFTPLLFITNEPNAKEGSLTSGPFSGPTIEVKEIDISAKTSLQDANPLQPIAFSVATTNITFASNDILHLNFGDGQTYNTTLPADFSVYHSFTKIGTYSPTIQLSDGSVTLGVYDLHYINITQIAIQSTPANGSLVSRTINLSLAFESFSQIVSVKLFIENNLVDSLDPAAFNDTIYFNYDSTGTGNLSVVWVLENVYGYSVTSDSYYDIALLPPTVLDILTYPSPAIVNQTVNFLGSINWNGNVGNLTWMVDSVQINGSYFRFSYTGNYSITVTAANQYGSSQKTVNIIVQPDRAPFVQALYPVRFTQSLFTSNSEWFVNFTNGLSYSSTSSIISLNLTNGTYSYVVGTTNTIYSAKGGSFTINGAPISIGVSFSLISYLITFTETGLPLGTNWTVILNGINQTYYTPALDFMMPNGTYQYTIGAEPGYNSSIISGIIVIHGSGYSRTVTFTQKPRVNKSPSKEPLLSQLNNNQLYVIIGAAAVGSAIAAVVIISFMRRRKADP